MRDRAAPTGAKLRPSVASRSSLGHGPPTSANSEARPRMPIASGTDLASYRIVGPLGAGAMGEVYRARDMRLGREVATNVLSPHFAADAERLKRFEREAQTLASLNHPNIAQIFQVEQVGEKCSLVLELVEGETLEDRLKRGPVSVAESMEIVRRIAAGLEAAHEAGVIFHSECRKSMPALRFVVRAFGPLFSHSISRRTALASESW